MKATVSYKKLQVTMMFDSNLKFEGDQGAVRIFNGISDHTEGFTPVSGMFYGVDRTQPDQVLELLVQLQKDPAFKVTVHESMDYTFPPLPLHIMDPE